MSKELHIELNKKITTKYEKARLIGTRALQISMGAPFLVKVSKKKLEEIQYNPIEIAKLEFESGKIPLDVFRKSRFHKTKKD